MKYAAIYPILKVFSLLWMAFIILSVTAGAFVYQAEIAMRYDVNSMGFALISIFAVLGMALVAVAPYAIIEYNRPGEN